MFGNKINFITIVFVFWSTNLLAAEWQWSIPVTGVISKETNAHPTAFLWIPPNCKQVRGVVIGQHNMLEEGILEHSSFRANLAKLGLAEIWITPGPDLIFNFKSAEVFESLMNDFAVKSGYHELRYSPVIPIGHSAAASYPWNFAAFYPQRTLALLSIHGDAPLTNMTGSGQPNPDWGDRNIDGIPALFVMGEYEWLEGRISPALKYKKDHPKSTIALFCDAGHGHFDYSDALIGYLNLFISKAAKSRLPKTIDVTQPVKLIAVNPEKGWLIDRWRNNALPGAPSSSFATYKGNRFEAGWAFDREMARATEKYYALARGKEIRNIGYAQDGKLVPPAGFAGFRPPFKPLSDGISFHLSAVNTNSRGEQISGPRKGGQRISINRICGPVIKVDDTTFRIAFDKLGFDNTKRSNDIWLMASQKGGERYKSAVQQANIKIPILNKEGRDQRIVFDELKDVKHHIKTIKLSARSDCGLPVSFYIKYGPAEIIDGELHLTKIPPKSKFPIQVTVVAWQYGINNNTGKIKSALPVEQSFMITE